jgi:hypothetical protein
LHVEQFETAAGPDNVHKCVHAADLVQMDVVGAHAMHACLRMREPRQHRSRACLDACRQVRCVHNRQQIRERSVRVRIVIDDDIDLSAGNHVAEFLLPFETKSAHT